MRKLTGYIGAMIIVFALMGSILAGYALNINGTNTVMNEYEKVTDVSGLYTHTQEPAYIDYNPASNYIGYRIDQSGSFTITNTSSANYQLSYQLYKNNGPNCAWNTSQHSTGAFYNDGVVVDGSTSGNQQGETLYFVILGDNIRAYVINPSMSTAVCHFDVINGGVVSGYDSANYTLSYSGGVLTIVLDGATTITHNTSWLIVPKNNGNYVPAFNGNPGYYQTGMYTLTGITPQITTVDTWNGEPVYNLYSATFSGSNYWVFVPKTVNYQPIQDLGINYIESNRVNNYPIINSNATTITQTTTLTVGNLSATDYWPDVPSGWFKTGYLIWETQPIYPHDTITAPYYYTTINLSDYNYGNTMLHQYKLTDILANYTIPTGTQTLKITTNSNDIRSYQYYNLDANIISFVNASDNGFIQSFNDVANKKDFLIYDIVNNICTVYDYNGVSLYSNTPDNIGVIFCDNTGAKYMRYNHFETVNDTTSGYFDMDSRPVPFITITANIYNPADIDYIDVTKGYTIKSTNVNNTVWDNEYINGNIKLLFRVENTGTTYHNGVIIGDNTVSIDYSSNRYMVSLNGGDPVDIGTWRNIILDIDLVNGKLSVIPVRTFNSFTNVVMDNTNIPIGDLVNPTTTNKIEWEPTVNSLSFNVYSTSVFMDTYGVVMVNPTMNVTDYFTNLNNFYQLRLSNFSIYGQSMTVNGVTGTVTGDKITFNGETVQLKEMTITYADGNVTISDSYGNIDLGAIVDNTISMTGAWYFISDLYSGYTTQKVIYDWDWGQFILDDKAFGVIYIGLCIIGLIVARHFCTLTITDYILFVVSIAIALTVPVIA